MKRIISFTLTLVMIVSMLAVSASAKGELIFSDNFDKGFASRNWINDDSCAFKWDSDNGVIHGYRDAVVLQSQFGEKYDKWWAKYYTSMDVQIRGFDDLADEEAKPHDVSIWYTDLMETGVAADDVSKRGANYLYTITIETGEAVLKKSYSFKYQDENGITQEGKVDNVIASGKIDGTIDVGEDAEWFNFGMRVTDGKIQCYYNEKLVLESSASDSTQKIGPVSVDSVDETVGTEKSAVLYFNGNNWVAFDNFEIWSDDYDFVPEIPYGDVNNDEKINMMDATKLLQFIAGWQVQDFVEANADVNGDGKVNLSDVTRLLQHIAGWDVVLGPATE